MCEKFGVLSSKSVPTYRTRTFTKKTYRTSVPYFLAKIEAYRTNAPYRTAILSYYNIKCCILLQKNIEKAKAYSASPDGGSYSASPDPLAGLEIVFTYFTFVFAMNLVGISSYQRSHLQVTMYSIWKFASNPFLFQALRKNFCTFPWPHGKHGSTISVWASPDQNSWLRQCPILILW